MGFTKDIHLVINAYTWKSKDDAFHTSKSKDSAFHQGSDLVVSAYTCKSNANAIHQGHTLAYIVLTRGSQRIVHFIKDMHLTILMLLIRNQSTLHFTKDRISILTIFFWKSKDNAIQHKVHGNVQHGIITFEGIGKCI